jgi:hypothetical protein
MTDKEVAIASSALEVILFELLECQPGDKIKVVAAVGTEFEDGVTVSTITVSRGEGKFYLLATEPLTLENTIRTLPDPLLNVAKNFLLETIQPNHKNKLHSIGRLMALVKAVNVEDEFAKEEYRLQKRNRMEQ